MYVVDSALDNRIHEVAIKGIAAVYRSTPGDSMHYALPLDGLSLIPDWGKGKRAERLFKAIQAAGWHCELVFDAAHGFRYALAVWPRSFEYDTMRRVARSAASGLDRTGD